MSDAPITESELQAYADGRLEPKRRMEVEAWLATRPDEAERIADYRRIAKELRSIYDPVIAESLRRASRASGFIGGAMRSRRAGC